MKKYFKYIAIILVITVAIGGFAIKKKINEENSSDSNLVQFTEVIASKGNIEISVSGDGNLTSSSRKEVRPDINGTIEEIYVSVGDYVEEGDLILTNEKDSSIYASISGTIINLDVEEGDTLIQNKNIATISELSDLEVVIQIDELDISKIKVGQVAILTSQAFPSEEYKGVVEGIAYEGSINNGNEIGVVQVYQSVEVERMFSSQLILTLIIIGLISIVILAVISYVLDGISLIPIKKDWNQQKDFVADASHELRTPLIVIQTNLDVALSDEEGTIEENHEWINNAYTESIKMSKLVNDLLLLAKIDSKEIYIKKESIDITELLKQVISHMRPMFNNKKIKLEENILDNVLVYGDYDRIRQLIIILLDNAIKYTNENRSVEITLENIENKTLLKVKDTGIGLSDEDKEKVFNRFYRGDKARTSENGGSGLGLSIAYWIVKTHNGTIKLESEFNKGSTFIVEFPKI